MAARYLVLMALSVFLLGSGHPPARGPGPTVVPKVTLSRGFAPVSITYSDLLRAVDELDTLARQADSTVSAGELHSSVDLKYVGGKLDYPYVPSGFAGAPSSSVSFRYLFECYCAAPVKEIDMTLGPYDRSLSVSGLSPDQVRAIFAAGSDALGLRASGRWRVFWFVSLATVAVLFIVGGFAIIEWARGLRWALLGALVSCVGGVLVFGVFSVVDFLAPLLRITAGDPSFRNLHPDLWNLLLALGAGLVLAALGRLVSLRRLSAAFPAEPPG